MLSHNKGKIGLIVEKLKEINQWKIPKSQSEWTLSINKDSLVRLKLTINKDSFR